MCLIVLAWRAHPDHPLIVAANRDEFHRRPTAPVSFWADQPSILAGRDLEAGGTWMGVSRNGRFAAVTNYRGAKEPSAPHSRGALVTGFLQGDLPPEAFLERIEGKAYSGFNLLVADDDALWWLSNRDGSPRALEPGIHGLGNLLLDSPEVEPAKTAFASTLEHGAADEPLFAAMARAKIVNPEYGTRCSTVFVRDRSGVRYAERSFSPDGAEAGTRRFAFASATARAA